jgi:hypothetical protein
MEEAERVFLEETSAATRAYNSQMMKLNAARDEEILRVKSMHVELLEAIQKYGMSQLDDAERTELAEMTEATRRIERDHSLRTAPVKEAYQVAIVPAQRRLQESRTRGKGRSPSELARMVK